MRSLMISVRGPAPTDSMPVGKDEKDFFVQFGARITDASQDAEITQAQLAETLEVSQQTVNEYEVGGRNRKESVTRQ